MGIIQDINIPSYTLIPERHTREVVLEKDEYQRLKEYWMKKNPYYWYIISFVNNTGIRYPSELLRICWKDVHLDRSYVLIRDRKNKNRSEPINTPVPIVGKAREIIEIFKNRQGIPKKPTDPVFLDDKGVQIKSITRPFKKSLRECGIEKNLTMYSLRHLFTTRMVKRPDIPIKVLSEVLGHKDTTMIHKFYSHLLSEHLVSVFQKSEDKKQEILSERKKQEELTKQTMTNPDIRDDVPDFV
jgi:integrase